MKPVILIVEDNPVSMRLMAKLLMFEDYEVRAAANAEDAMALLRDVVPHLVLTDIDLPQMTGLEFTRALRARPETANAPVIAITAHAMQRDRDEALAAGCNEVLTKPFDTRFFLQLIREKLRPALPEGLRDFGVAPQGNLAGSLTGSETRQDTCKD